jgi:hypothetical protein
MTGVPTIPKRSHFLLDPPALLTVPRLAPGALRAIDASTPIDASTLKELWNSEQDTGNKLGDVAKFTPVTIANGKVYVPTFSNKLVVYELKKP